MAQIYELRGPKGKPRAKATFRPPPQRVQHFWDQGRFYEQRLLQYIYERYQGGVFIDAGSCMGNHTLWFTLYCKPSLVVSIEPMREMMDWQIENLKLNEIDHNVRCFNVALSDTLGQGKMIKSPSNPKGRWHWHRGMWELEKSEKGPTEITTLDRILEENAIKNITLIKMDIEGHEMKALAGAVGLLEREHPVLFLETAPEERHLEYAAFLQQFGYGPGKRVYTKIYEFTWQK